MDHSIRDANTCLTEAAAARGERAATARRALGLDGLTIELPAEFDDPAFSRSVLGLPGSC